MLGYAADGGVAWGWLTWVDRIWDFPGVDLTLREHTRSPPTAIQAFPVTLKPKIPASLEECLARMLL
jgi:hypothetical protein